MNKIIYLDAAASYQKSSAVIDAQVDFLRNHYANSGRGICARAAFVDNMLDDVRRGVADFIGACPDQVVFTSGTTDAMNVVARMLVGCVVGVSDLDHHSARLPFEQVASKVKVCPLDKNFNIDVDKLPDVDVLVITAMSNVLGMAQDVKKIIHVARKKNPNVITVVDAAQYVVHNNINVRELDCDFLCFSGHKIGADTGLGVLYVKNPDDFAPVKFGGGMVNKIVDGKLLLNSAPDKFEAGTLPLTQISGLGVAIDELKKNRPDINLVRWFYDELSKEVRVKILSSRDACVVTFIVDDMHVLDFGALIGARGVCLRVGNMCASWIHQRLGVVGTIRVSVGAYNTIDELKTVIGYIKDILK